MAKKYNLDNLKEFDYNPFLNYKSDKIFDKIFIDALSKTAKCIIKHLIYKQTFTKEKFLFNIEEFNRSMRYINMPDPSDRLAELYAKELLAKTKEVDVSWVNKDLFNIGVFEPKHMACMEEDSPIKLKPTQDPESEKEISQ